MAIGTNGTNHNHSGLHDLEFHKLQLMYQFSKIVRGLDEIENTAKAGNDIQFQSFLTEIRTQLQEYIETLHAMHHHD